mmetsp:Transcript_14065/g.38466  ORF Transcript_14065/g.38466 Transcript_14065/m.38466 type:complete len:229 (+) Transcript_14065:67-753(+)
MGFGGAGKSFRVVHETGTVWIGGLPQGIGHEAVKEHMMSAGSCKHVQVLKNGTAFALFSSPAEAQTAIDMLNGSELNGEAIIVDRYEKTGGQPSAWNQRGQKACGTKSLIQKPALQKGAFQKGAFQKGASQKGASQKHASRKMSPGTFKVVHTAGTVWIGDLPANTNFRQLQEHMGQAGECKHVQTLQNGTAFALYASPDQAKTAIEILNGSVFNGSVIVVDTYNKTR